MNVKTSISTLLLCFALTDLHAATYPKPIVFINKSTQNGVRPPLKTDFGAGQVNGRWLIPYHINFQQLPSGISSQAFQAAVAKAATRWEQVCNIKFDYRGSTTFPALTNISQATGRTFAFNTLIAMDSTNIISGNVSEIVVNNVGSYDPTDAFDDMAISTPYYDLDKFSVAKNPASDQMHSLTNMLTHALGHMIALSDVAPDREKTRGNPETQKYYTAMMTRDGDAVFPGQNSRLKLYSATIRGADVEGCESIYGKLADQDSRDINRALNYLEGEDTHWASIGYRPGEITQYTTFSGKNLAFRYYPETKTYVGISTNESPRKVYMIQNGSSQLTEIATYQSILNAANANTNEYGVRNY